MPSLLPANRTPLETALSLAIGPRLFDDPLPLAGFKAAPTDDLVLWLIWEYGLDELLPYLTDPRQALRDGVQFQRLRGTDASLRMALGWIGYDEAAVEEAGPGPWFAHVQMDPGRVPSVADARRIIGVASLALPARAHLIRLYHGYDLRPVLASGDVALDEGLLDDDSGVDLDGIRQSYGLYHRTAIAADVPEIQPAGTISHWGGAIVYTDRPLLDHWAFGDDVVFNNPVIGSELTTLATAGLPLFIGRIGVPLAIPRAALVASESVLGDTNAILGAYGTIETGDPLVASGTAALSDYHLAASRVIFDEVFEQTVGSVIPVSAATAPTMGGAMAHALTATPVPPELVLDGEAPEPVNHPAAGHGLITGTGGPFDAPWPAAPWSNQPWGAVVWAGSREETMAPTALAGLVFADQGMGTQRSTVSLAAGLGASVSSLIWSGAVITPEEMTFWDIVPWPGMPWGDRIYCGGGGFGGWAAQLFQTPRLGLSTPPYTPMWPDAAWSAHRWSDPVVSVAVTSTGA